MAEDIEKLFRKEARKHGATEALRRKSEREKIKFLNESYKAQQKELGDLHEGEAELKAAEDSWIGKRKIGAGHWWKRRKTSAKHWGDRQGKRIKDAPDSTYHGARRAATGTPGLAAAVPEVAMAKEVAEAVKGQVEETKGKVKTGLVKLGKVLLVLAIIGIVFYYFTGTTTGSGVSAEAGGVITPITNVAKESGVIKTINQFKMIMTGEYDPSQLWTSKTYEDRYAMVEDVGVKISNIKPLRDPFLSNQQLAILGNVRVASLPEEEESTVAIIGAKWSTWDQIKDAFGEGNELSESWDCNGDEPGNKLEISKARLFVGRFMCTHKALTVKEGITESHDADVTVAYSFSMKAGKQVYVGDYEQMTALMFEDQDPMKYYGIKKDQTKSWQTESPVGLGLGILGEEEIVIANKKDEYELGHYLGVTVENIGSGDLLKIDSLKVTLPSTIEIATDLPKDERDFVKVSTDDEIKVEGADLDTYLLIDTNLKEPLAPGEFKTYFLKFRVWDGIGAQGEQDFLQGVPISSFFVLSELKFNYIESRAVSIKIKNI